MHKLLMNLFAIPTVASSVLMTSLMIGVAAAEEPTEPIAQASCAPISTQAHPVRRHNTRSASPHYKNLRGVIQVSMPTPNIDFSAAESDAAVTLFGCDCPACIGVLRQLRAQTFTSGEGHCWGALQQNFSPEEVQEVLQTLEAQEALEAY
ncbi:MAG: hypothetical protein HC895_15445 [Leptolyngbyaceae cyanobacterium SM1_3_5]|nr:hypothetical protein [Leptolyngbyaceae cyanobacterium SM1_3_5]